ncbi:MAG: PAS domain S-box protein [Gallionella sp.]|nr:PAS domain S-box protein [Gallionella sp.]
MNTTHKIIAWFSGAVLLVMLGVALSFWTFRQIETAAAVRTHTYTILDGAAELLSELRDAETSQRGYLLTSDEAFLQPYLKVRDTIVPHLQRLRAITLVDSAQQHLAIVAPLVDAKMAEMARVLALQSTLGNSAAVAMVRNGAGKHQMDTIRAEMHSFIDIEQAVLAQREEEFQSSMRKLFALIVAASLLTLVAALAFAYFLYNESRQRLKNLVHLETRHLLDAQQQISKQLQDTNLTLQVSEERLAVTLNSIGDAVIATDIAARVTLLNPIAEQLTGWTQAEAAGRPIAEIFPIINKETRLPVAIPVVASLAFGTIQGLANHTVLTSRDGSEYDIADSCAPIRDSSNNVVGAVLVFRDVTAEYVVQQALRDNTALIQTILNTVVDGIITLRARGGIITTVNPSAESMFGYSSTELLEQNFSLLIPELDQDQRNGSLEYYQASDSARASGLGREVMGQRKDGSRFPMEIAVSEMWLGKERYFTGILRDISTRKAVEAALLEASALQNAIFTSANFSSIATDAKGVIQIFNVGAERMLGYAAADVVNKITPADISDPLEVIIRAAELSEALNTPIAAGFEALVFKASRGIEDIYDLTYIRKDGSRFPAVVSVTALRDAQSNIIGYLLIGTDNTARKQVEAERVQLYDKLQKKNTELELTTALAENANHAKSTFLSRMSHELRTPLNAILGFAQLLESGTPAPTSTQAERLHHITKAGWYLLELINEILDLAVIESGKLSLSHEPVALTEVMHECQAMIESQAQQHGIRVNFHPFETSWCAYADRTRVKQVLANLLSNAVKYNREQGTVDVTCSLSTPQRIRVTIKDSGMGLSPQQLQQLFQPFNRLGQESGTEEGTGIGLVVTKQLVELMGGTLGVESTPGVGSEFWFELIRDVSLPTSTHMGMGMDMGMDTALRTLLYVEDNPANLILVEQIISRHAQFKMLSARDGKLGIAMALEHLPDIILMDINLPGINGTQAMQLLGADPRTQHIPVLALSANAMPRDIEQGLQAGFFRYLTKPIKLDEFLLALEEAVQLSAARTPDNNPPGTSK